MSRLEMLVARDRAVQEWSRTEGSPELVGSDSNDVWRTERHVLRVCWRGDVSRMEREAAVGASLPTELGYPSIVGFGLAEECSMSWMLTRRLSGVNLGRDAWPDMTLAERQDAVTSCARRLRAVHDWQVPTPLRHRLEARDGETRSASEIAQSYINPVPLAWTETLVAACQDLVPAALCSSVNDRLALLADHDPFVGDEPRVLVHGDLSPANVLWRGRGDLSVLDFEWCRIGVRDMDLLSFADVPNVTPGTVAGWLYDAYPELFAYDSLLERLWLYQLAIAARQVIAWSASPGNVERLRAVSKEPPEYVRQLVESVRER